MLYLALDLKYNKDVFCGILYVFYKLSFCNVLSFIKWEGQIIAFYAVIIFVLQTLMGAQMKRES